MTSMVSMNRPQDRESAEARRQEAVRHLAAPPPAGALRWVRRRRRRRVYAPLQHAAPARLLDRVLRGLRRLDAAPSRPSRAGHARDLAGVLAPMAHRLRVVRPEAWAPPAMNAPHPDLTTTAPMEVVSA